MEERLKQIYLKTILVILFLAVAPIAIISRFSVPFQVILAIISWFVCNNFSKFIVNKLFEHCKSIYEKYGNKEITILKTYQEKEILSIQLDQLKEKEKRLDQKYQQATQTRSDNQTTETKQIQPINHTYEQSEPKTYTKKNN